MAAGIIEPDGETYQVTDWQERLEHNLRHAFIEDDDESTDTMYS